MRRLRPPSCRRGLSTSTSCSPMTTTALSLLAAERNAHSAFDGEHCAKFHVTNVTFTSSFFAHGPVARAGVERGAAGGTEVDVRAAAMQPMPHPRRRIPHPSDAADALLDNIVPALG